MPDGSNGLTDDLFADLIESVREGGAILQGERAPARQFEFEGSTMNTYPFAARKLIELMQHWATEPVQR